MLSSHAEGDVVGDISSSPPVSGIGLLVVGLVVGIEEGVVVVDAFVSSKRQQQHASTIVLPLFLYSSPPNMIHQ